MTSSDQYVYVSTAAHLTGTNNVNWRTDLEVQNPGSAQAKYSIALLRRGEDNSDPAHVDLTLDPGQSVRYIDVLQTLFGFSGAAALCIVPIEGTVVAASRTYGDSGSGTYGSFVPAVARANAIAVGEDGRLIGLSHDRSLAAGFRTNIGLVNANEYPLTVEADFCLADGTLLGTASYDLQPFEFRQSDGAFEQFTGDRVEDGYVVVRMASGAGGQPLDATAKFFAYASVIDNITGDPTYVPPVAFARPQPVQTTGYGYFTWTSIKSPIALCNEITRQVGMRFRLWVTMKSEGDSVTLGLWETPPSQYDPRGDGGPGVWVGTRSGDAITATYTGPMGGLACPGDTAETAQTGGELTATILGNQITGDYTAIYGEGANAVTFFFHLKATFQ